MSKEAGGGSNISLAADQILRIAAEVNAAETAIKAELLRAARAGESPRVIDLVSRWMTLPATEVLNPGGSAEQRLIDVPESR